MKIEYKICKLCGKYYDDKFCHCSTPTGEIVKHHLLEYYFTQKQLIDLGYYWYVSKHHILEIDKKYHFKVINGFKLHCHIYADNFDYWRDYITPDAVERLIDQIPKELIDTFKNLPVA